MPTKNFRDAHRDAARCLGSTVRRVEEDLKGLFPYIKNFSFQPTKKNTVVNRNNPPTVAPSRTIPEQFRQTQQDIRQAAPEKKTLAQDDSSNETTFEDSTEQAQAEVFLNDLKSETSAIRLQALREIKKLSKPTVVKVLKRLLAQDSDPLKTIEILNTLSNIVEGQSVPKDLFKEYLESPNVKIRLAALRAVSKYRDEESFEILTNHVKDKIPEVRRQVLNCLCWDFEERCVPYAVNALHDVDAGVQQTACKIIGVFKSPEAISALITLLNGPDRDVQECAATVLKKMTGQNFGFRSTSSNKNKQAAIDDWRLWWCENQAKFGH